MRRLIPLALLALLVGLMVLLHWAVPLGKVMGHPLSYVGVLPVVVGVTVSVLGLCQLLRAGTTVRAFRPPDRLVSGGIFRHTRNPIYLGMALVLAGVCILLGLRCLLVPVLLFVVVADKWIVRVEERMLARKFGENWEKYRAGTPRWI